MTTVIDPTKSYKTKYTKTYLDSVNPSIYTFLNAQGYVTSSETILAGDYLDGVLLVADQTEPDVIVDASGDPVCFWGLNGCGGGSEINIEDADGNITVLNGNDNIPTSTLDVISGKVELDNISKTYSAAASSGFLAMANGTFILATTPDIDLTPIHQNMSENFYLDPTAYFNYSIGTTTNYVFSTEYSTNSGATWSNWEVGSTISIAPSGPSTGTYYLTANDDPINSTAPSTVRFRSIVTVTSYNGGNILSTLLRVRGIGVVGVKI